MDKNAARKPNRFILSNLGFSPKSDRQLKENDIPWADFIIVMEQGHGARIAGTYRHLDLPEIEVLHIEDDYHYLSEELIELLSDRINSTLKIKFKL